MKEMPFGYILKSSTGMGATHLELNISQRNSIVVSPLLSILESKKDNPFIFQVHGKTLKKDFQMYVTQLNPDDGHYEKIHCSSDSVTKLFQWYAELQIDVFNGKYFFLLDEIDLFQTQSNFRERLADSLDYLEKFPTTQSAILSAINYRFFDKTLNSLARTEIKYSNQPNRKIELHLTNNPNLEAIGLINDLCATTKDQIFVFYNSIDDILKIISALKIAHNDIAIYCGSDDESRVKAHAHLVEFNKRPKHRVNFYTSAFFSGCDLETNGIVITVSDVRRSHKKLLMNQIFQIGGRLRMGITKDIFVTNLDPGAQKIDSDLDNKIKQKAECELKLAEQVFALRNEHPDQIKIWQGIKKTFINEGYVRINLDNKPALNPFLIDREIAVNGSSFFYQSERTLRLFLNEKWFFEIIKVHKTHHSSGVVNCILPISKNNRMTIFNKVVNHLKFLNDNLISQSQKERQMQQLLSGSRNTVAKEFIIFARNYGYHKLISGGGKKYKMRQIEQREFVRKQKDWKTPFKINATYSKAQIVKNLRKLSSQVPHYGLKVDEGSAIKTLKIFHDIKRTRIISGLERRNVYLIIN